MNALGRLLTALAPVLVTAALLAPTSGSSAASPDASESGGGPVELAPVAASYAPKARALFGRPGNNGIRRAVVAAIANTPRGARIRVATWAFTDVGVARALVRADRRGARVQVVMARGQAKTKAARLLKRKLRRDFRSKRGAARKAKRNKGGTMHQKSWTFSRTGGKKYVTIVTSANPTDNATKSQYNDGWQFVDYKAAYAAVNKVFAKQFKGGTYAKPFRHAKLSPNTALVFGPWNSPSMKDPVVERIRNLPNRKLVIRAANAAFWGARGEGIARALAAKKRGGANVRVIYGKPVGAGVKRILRSAGIPLQNAYWSDSRYLHGKFMTASWVTNGARKYRVWTGSENWGNGSIPSDELVAKIGNKKGYDAFLDWFWYLWRL